MQVSAKPQALLLNDCVCTRECTCMRRPSSACIFRTLKGVLCIICVLVCATFFTGVLFTNVADTWAPSPVCALVAVPSQHVCLGVVCHSKAWG